MAAKSLAQPGLSWRRGAFPSGRGRSSSSGAKYLLPAEPPALPPRLPTLGSPVLPPPPPPPPDGAGAEAPFADGIEKLGPSLGASGSLPFSAGASAFAAGAALSGGALVWGTVLILAGRLMEALAGGLRGSLSVTGDGARVNMGGAGTEAGDGAMTAARAEEI